MGKKMRKSDAKDLSPGMSDDMSSEAIARRLEIASQWWGVVNAFGVGRLFLGKVGENRSNSVSLDLDRSQPTCV